MPVSGTYRPRSPVTMSVTVRKTTWPNASTRSILPEDSSTSPLPDFAGGAAGLAPGAWPGALLSTE